MAVSLARLIRHIAFPHTRVHRHFDAAALAAIGQAIGEGERLHGAQIRFAIEGGLPWSYLARNAPVRQRAVMVFSKLRVWDTEHNTGVLVYVNLADRSVDIVADRGVAHVVGAQKWRGVCTTMEAAFSQARWAEGAVQGLQAMSRELAVAVPKGASDAGNELSDRPIVL